MKPKRVDLWGEWAENRFVTVRCMAGNGEGCGEVWLEGFGLYHIACPVCGRLVFEGNIIVNDEGTPDVRRLDNENVLVIFEEEGHYV